METSNHGGTNVAADSDEEKSYVHLVTVKETHFNVPLYKMERYFKLV